MAIKMMEIKNLETERLMLRPMSVADAPFIFELYNSPKFIEFIGDRKDAPFILELYNSPKFIEFIGDRKLRTLEDAENYIQEKFFPQIERLGYGNYLIVRKSDNAKIGSVGIFERDGLDVHDIGFSFLDEFQGKGYGFEAASKLLEKAFSDFGITKVSAITVTENIASRKLIEKLGLKYVKMVQLPGDDVKLMYYETENSNKKRTHQ